MPLSREASILIVDDEVDTCRNLSDIFSDLGFRVEMAHEGRTAIEKVRTARYDLVILDLMMPGMDGLAVYEEIRQIRPETVAVLATAYSNHPRAEQSISIGVWQLVPKPVDIARLLSIVDEVANQPLVLVVDDDHDLCHNLWDILRAKNFRVSMTHDMKGVREKLESDAFDIVLIDMRLPDGDGSEVFRLVHQLETRPRTVLITGNRADLEPALEELLACGADAICYKPFNLEELFATVERLSRTTKDSSPEAK